MHSLPGGRVWGRKRAQPVRVCTRICSGLPVALAPTVDAGVCHVPVGSLPMRKVSRSKLFSGVSKSVKNELYVDSFTEFYQV